MLIQTPPSRLGLAVGLTALNYAALTGYDLLAFAYIGKTLPRVRVALASFLAYAISNNVGFAMLSGASVRYRFYTRWGVTAEELSRIVFSYSVTFWLGLLGLGGLGLIVSPLSTAGGLPAQQLLVPVGWLLIAVPPLYLLATIVHREPLKIGSFELALTSRTIAAGQALVSVIEWALAGAVLYVLLPPNGLSFLQFLGAFLIAILIGMASHVPGGVGVFEGLMVLLLKPYLTSGQLLPSLVVYRVVYYLLPLTAALIGLVTDEVRQRRSQAARVRAVLGQLTEQLAPRLLAFFTFLAGLLLLFSSATPAANSPIQLIGRVLPQDDRASHLLSSVAGAALLILSHGLSRRLDAAYYLTGTMVTGMAASLLKAATKRRRCFTRAPGVVAGAASLRSPRGFFETRFSSGWMPQPAPRSLGVVGDVRVPARGYSHELWWQFEMHHEASRFLRASVGAPRCCCSSDLPV